MRYFAVHLLTETQTGTDVLGNPIQSLQAQEPAYKGRFTEWTAEDIALSGREITQTQRKILTDAPLEPCRRAAAVRAGNTDYPIIHVADLHGRWRLLYVKKERVS